MSNPIRDEWISKDGRARLLLGDCLEILPTLRDFDAVVTDPPYGIGFRYQGSVGREVGDSSYTKMIARLRGLPVALLQYPEEMMRLVVPALGAPSECLAWVYPSNLPRQFRLWGLWGLAADFNNVKQPAKNPECAKVINAMVASYDWWEQPQVKGNSPEKTEHPCQIPVSCAGRVISLIDKQSILDPFMGSGSVGVAALSLGKRFTGIEIGGSYFAIAKQRIERALCEGADCLPFQSEAEKLFKESA